MTNKILQCCYTNASQMVGGKLSSGWQAVAVSPNIPADAYATCVKLQGVNSTIQGSMEDEKGEILNLFEITGDGKYLYISRTKYGLLDRVGRQNMFSHAFILPCKDSKFISDPNNFLTIADENYKYNEEDADFEKQDIVRNPDFNLKTALQVCNLSDELYVTLIRCVYTQFFSNKKISKPLFVQYDGTKEQIQNLLFCIYSGIPLSMRRKLSIASNTTPNLMGKNIIFSTDAKSKEVYVIPSTGENNILTSKLEKRISTLKFVDYPIQNYRELDQVSYFCRLEEKAIELGDITATDELVLKISYQMLYGLDIKSISNNELDIRISDALRSKTLGNPVMDQYIVELLSEVMQRSMILTNVNENSLNVRLQSTKLDELTDISEKYNSYHFGMVSLEEGAKKLSQMPPSLFEESCKKLCETENGIKILDRYFAKFELNKSPITWERLQEVLNKASIVLNHSELDDKISEEAWKLYCKDIEDVIDLPNFEIQKLYSKYMNLMRQIISESEVSSCANTAKEEYWEHFKFSVVSFELYSNYEEMSVDLPKCRLILKYCELPQVFRKEGEEAFFRKTKEFFTEYEKDLSKEERSNAEKKLIQSIKDCNRFTDKDFIEWYKLFLSLPEKELSEKLLEIRDCVVHKDVEHLLQNYKEFLNICTLHNIPRSEVEKLTNLLINKCIHIDRNNVPVSLDCWLALSKNIYPNSFLLFDKIEPRVLALTSYEVMKNCHWIEEERFVRDAKDYIKEKGSKSKQVKEWLNESKRINKKKPENLEKKSKEKSTKKYSKDSGSSKRELHPPKNVRELEKPNQLKKKITMNWLLLLITIIIGGASWFIGAIVYNFLGDIIPRPVLIGLLFGGLCLILSIFAYFYGNHIFNNPQKKRWITGICTGIFVILTFTVAALFQWVYESSIENQVVEPTSYVFLIDESSSMKDSDSEQQRYGAIQKILKNMSENTSFMVYGFSDEISLKTKLRKYSEGVPEVSIKNEGSKNIENALDKVLKEVKNKKILKVILLTDGKVTNKAAISNIKNKIKEYNKKGIGINIVGLGEIKQNALRTTRGFVGNISSNSLSEDIKNLDKEYVGGDLLSTRYTMSFNILFALLRIIFVAILGILIGLSVAIAYGFNKSIPLIIVTSIIKSIIGALILEIGISIFRLPDEMMWLVLWILLSMTIAIKFKKVRR